MSAADPRDHEGPETNAWGYRQRHAQYKADADLQAAHAIAPWLVVWDDHEVDNNWADEVPGEQDAGQLNDTTEHFRQRRAAAFQAYYENMPLRASSVPAGSDMKIYRTIQWGQLANFHMMDTRQYRDDQLAGDGWKKNVAERLAEDRTITGAEQEKWLLDGFRNSTQRWDILGQQVFFAERDRNQAAGHRRRLHGRLGRLRGVAPPHHPGLGGRERAQRRRPHRRRAPQLGQRPQGRLQGPRLAGGGLRTGLHVHYLHGQRLGLHHDPIMAWNPHLKFYNDNRGYVNTRITKDSMTGGLPGAGLRHHAGVPGQHEGLVRDQRRRSGP